MPKLPTIEAHYRPNTDGSEPTLVDFVDAAGSIRLTVTVENAQSIAAEINAGPTPPIGPV